METEVLKEHMERLKRELGARIEPLETPNIDISSNMLRERAQRGQSIRYYVPDSVESYIREQGLYRKNKEEVKLLAEMRNSDETL